MSDLHNERETQLRYGARRVWRVHLDLAREGGHVAEEKSVLLAFGAAMAVLDEYKRSGFRGRVMIDESAVAKLSEHP